MQVKMLGISFNLSSSLLVKHLIKYADSFQSGPDSLQLPHYSWSSSNKSDAPWAGHHCEQTRTERLGSRRLRPSSWSIQINRETAEPVTACAGTPIARTRTSTLIHQGARPKITQPK